MWTHLDDVLSFLCKNYLKEEIILVWCPLNVMLKDLSKTNELSGNMWTFCLDSSHFIDTRKTQTLQLNSCCWWAISTSVHLTVTVIERTQFLTFCPNFNEILYFDQVSTKSFWSFPVLVLTETFWCLLMLWFCQLWYQKLCSISKTSTCKFEQWEHI